VFVTHPAYIREKARQLRVERDMTIDEIAERLAISRQTIFHWVKDLPLRHPPRRSTEAQERRNRTNSLRYKALRDAAYEQGFEEYDELIKEPTFRDFVSTYIGEGYKRSRNTVSVCNSDPQVMVLADYWMRRFASNPLDFSIQYHADQDPEDLRGFWGRYLRVEPESIRLQRKSNSNQLTGRNWRSRFGVLAIRTGDTYFRARLQAWMDRIFDEWLHLPAAGV
jgi:AcrR family transcriptional regulator